MKEHVLSFDNWLIEQKTIKEETKLVEDAKAAKKLEEAAAKKLEEAAAKKLEDINEFEFKSGEEYQMKITKGPEGSSDYRKLKVISFEDDILKAYFYDSDEDEEYVVIKNNGNKLTLKNDGRSDDYTFDVKVK